MIAVVRVTTVAILSILVCPPICYRAAALQWQCSILSQVSNLPSFLGTKHKSKALVTINLHWLLCLFSPFFFLIFA